MSYRFVAVIIICFLYESFASAKPKSLDRAQVEKIISVNLSESYDLSTWVIQPWLSYDLNSDGIEELIALIREKNAPIEHGNKPPTHIIIFHRQKSEQNFDTVKEKFLVKMDQGQPMSGDRNSFILNKDSKFLKTIGCLNQVAIQMIEEASTSFYLCWSGKKYEFYRDAHDTP